ncbi:MAG: TIGR03986 family CRISPR-associated RAMP protein [Deltaproteobacteria bacterium]|nr:TIGR03986 family CRISPR-associated RAMP protein [Deltaproteobacteria bacterium]
MVDMREWQEEMRRKRGLAPREEKSVQAQGGSKKDSGSSPGKQKKKKKKRKQGLQTRHYGAGPGPLRQRAHPQGRGEGRGRMDDAPQFHNPYHFVPVLKDNRPADLSVEKFDSQENGHVRHDRYVEGSYSGRIVCRLKSESPIFVGAKRVRKGKQECPACVAPYERGGKPAVPATTLKGLISSIAEAASNSALRVLERSEYPYSYRKEMTKSLSAIGMIHVEKEKGGQDKYFLVPLTLPTLQKNNNDRFPLPAEYQNMFPEPNLKVYIGDRLSIRNSGRFTFRTFRADSPKYYGMKLQRRSWTGSHELCGDAQLHVTRNSFLVSQKAREDAVPRPWDEIPDHERSVYTRGIIRVLGCWGDRAIPNTKKHEIFIPCPEKPEAWEAFLIPDDVVNRFHELADARTDADENGKLPYEPKDTKRNMDPANDGKKFRLKEGDLVFFKPHPRWNTIEEISLSSIWRGRVEWIVNNRMEGARGRDFFRAVDKELLPFNGERKQITLAEQLFGFVEEGKEKERDTARALAGRVRFADALFEGITDQDGQTPIGREASPYLDPVVLKILDSPKPPSPALYFKKSDGQGAYIAKKDLQPGSHHPQGRKFYLHHSSDQLEKECWKTDPQPPTPCEEKDRCKQKVSVTPVRAGAVFYFHVDFDNLSKRELGLLCYALRPTEAFRHKIGTGKPIGLGKVRIDPIGLFLVNREDRYTTDEIFSSPRYAKVWRKEDAPEDWPGRYGREAEAEVAEAEVAGAITYDAFRKGFRDKMNEDIRPALELLGDPAKVTEPVHTPLVQGQGPEDETFKWFVENDKRRHDFLRPLNRASTNLPTLKKY